MTDRHFSEQDIERALSAAGEQLEVPSMADTVARALARIHAAHSPPAATSTEQPAADVDDDALESEVTTGSASIMRLEPQPNSRRELALLAGGLAVAAVVTLVLVALFQGLLDGGSDDSNDDAVAGSPIEPDPFDIPDYDFVQAYGTPAIPNQAVDVLFDGEGRMLAVDDGIRRIVALNNDGSVDGGWGDDGFSEQLRANPIRGANGPNGNIYVYEKGNFIEEVTVFDPSGQIVAEWKLGPMSGPIGGGIGITSAVSPGDIAVDESGVVYVARPLGGQIARFSAEGSELPSIEFEDGSPAGVASTDDGVYVVTSGGSLWRIEGDDAVEDDGPDLNRVVDLDAGGDGSLIALQLLREEDDRVARFMPGDDDVESWPVDAGVAITALGSVSLPGISAGPDETVYLAAVQQISVYDTNDEVQKSIQDADRGTLPSLERLAVGPDGTVLALSISGRALEAFGTDGEHLSSFELLDQSDQFLTEDPRMSPADVAAGDDEVTVIDQRASHVYRFDPTGEPLDNWSGLNRDDGFSSPRIVETTSDGSIYLVDPSNQLKHYSSSGDFFSTIGDLEGEIGDLAVAGDDLWAIAEGTIYHFAPNAESGEVITTIAWDVDDGSERPVIGVALANAPDGTIALVYKPARPLNGFPAYLTLLDASGDVISTTKLPVPANVEVDVAFGPDGDLYITDGLNKMVYRYARAAREVKELPTPADEPPDEPEFTINPGQPEPQPFEIPGYESTRAIGGPTVPNEPFDVLVGDDGTYYVLDAGLHCIVTLDADGEVVESWGAKGLSAELRRPLRLAQAPDEMFYVLERGREEATIAVLNTDGRLQDRWQMPRAEDVDQPTGPAALSSGGIVATDDGIYVADLSGSRVIRYDNDGQVRADIPFVVEGEAPAAISSSGGRILVLSVSGTLWEIIDGDRQQVADLPITPPMAMTGDSSTLYILDLKTSSTDDPWELLQVQIGDWTTDRWDTDISGFPFGFTYTAPGLGIGPSGEIAIAALHHQRVAIYSRDGELQSEMVGDQPDQLVRPWRIAIGPDKTLHVSDSDDRARLARFDRQGDLLDAFLLDDQFNVVPGQNPYLQVSSFGVDADGEIVIPNRKSPAGPVYHYAADGTLVHEWGENGFNSDEGLVFPSSLDVAPDGSIYLNDESGQIKHFSADGEFVNAFGSVPGQHVDLHVTNDQVWVLANATLTRFSLDGTESEAVIEPEAIGASDAIPGDHFGGYAFAIAPNGTIALSGVGLPGFTHYIGFVTPDGDLIDAARLGKDDIYVDVAYAPDGTLYLADSKSKWVYQYEPVDAPDQEAAAPTQPPPEEGPAGSPTLDELLAEAPEIDGYDPIGNVGGPVLPLLPTDTQFSTDGERIFVADHESDRVIAFLPNGEIDTSWGRAGLSEPIKGPMRLALDHEGRLHAAGIQFGPRAVSVYRISDDGSLTTVAEITAELTGLAVDEHGVVIADRQDRSVRTFKYDGGGERATTDLNAPLDVTIGPNGRRYVLTGDTQDGDPRLGVDEVAVAVLDEQGGLVESWTLPNEGDEDRGAVFGIDTDEDGNLVIDRTIRNERRWQTRAEIYSPDGERLDSFDTAPVRGILSFISYPTSFDVEGAAGERRIAMADEEQQRVVISRDDDSAATEIQAGNAAPLAALTHVRFGPEGDLYALDPETHRVLRFDSAGTLITVYDASRPGLLGYRTAESGDTFTIADDGTLYFAVHHAHQIAVFAPDGEQIDVWPDEPRNDLDDQTTLFLPYGIELANDGTLLITDEQGGFIKRFSTDGEYLEHWVATDPNTLYLRFGTSFDRDEVLVSRGDRIERYNLGGELLGTIEGTDVAFDLAMGPDGAITMVVPRAVDNRAELSIERVDPSGEILSSDALPEQSTLAYVAHDSEGRLAVADTHARTVWLYEPGS